MPIELIETPEPSDDTPEYLIVSDTDSTVIFSSKKENADQPLAVTVKLANFIRKAGGSVTIFKATKY